MAVDRQWLHKWIHRWEHGGRKWAALDDKPSVPKTIKSYRHQWQHDVLDLRKRYGYGAQKIRHVGRLPISHTTINRILQETKQVRKRPYKQRKYRRFERPFSNYLWQIDTCQISTKSDGWVYIQTILDDHSRFVVASRSTNHFPTQADTIQLVGGAIRMWGPPLQVLTDNGSEFAHTTRDEAGLFTQWLWQLGIRHIRGRPNHPRTQGKIERWHRSMKTWIRRGGNPRTHHELQRRIQAWLDHYNGERPHCALRMRTPAEVHLESLMLRQDVARLVNEVP